MASISGRGAKGHHTYTLTLTQGTQSVANNSTTVSFSFDLTDDSNWFWSGWNQSISYSVSANGAVIASGYIPNHTTKNQNIAKGTFSVAHNADGSKSIAYSFSVSDGANQSYTSGNASASGTMALSTIPRYPIVNHSESGKTETYITMNWSSDSTIDYVWYSTDWGTTWIDVGNVNATSGSYTINRPSNGGDTLAPNTTYNIITCLRRKDSQQWKNSEKLSVTTYDIPHITATPDFVIGSQMYMPLYNPLGRTITATMVGDNGNVIWTATGWTGNSIGGNNAPNDIENLYRSIPNKRSGTYTMKIKYGDYPEKVTPGGTYSIVGNEIPTINGFGYHDGAEWVVRITQNDKQIVQNKSDLCATAIAATPQYWAGSITQYVFECNGASRTESQPGTYSLGTVNSTQNVNLTLTVVDSRGLSATQTIEVEMVPHADPTAVVTLKRLNNYEDTTYLKVDGSVSRVDGKNAMAIKYRYKVSGGEYPKDENGNDLYITINDNDDKYTVPEPLDKNNVYIFEVIVSDSFGATNYNKEHTLGKGVFPLFIDVEKNSIGVNKFPASENSFEASGLIHLGDRGTITLEMGQTVEVSIPFEQCSGLVNFRINGGNLEIARLFYVFRNNMYFGLHKTLVDESHNNTSAAVPMEPRNGTYAYIFKITNNHSSVVTIRYGMLKLC